MDFLRNYDGATEEMITLHLDEYKSCKPVSITGDEGVFRKLIGSLVDQRSVPNTLEDISRFGDVLHGFDPIAVIAEHESWESLFDRFNTFTPKPKGPFKKDSSKDTWVKFSKGVLDSARFLSRFNDSIKQYEEFLDRFLINEYSRLALALLLAQEIHFMGFALACNFLKESTESGAYVKPDVHIIDICQGLGISQNGANQYTVFKDVIRFAESIGEAPYRVDKAFWLIGSRKFYLSFPEDQQVRKHLQCPNTDTKKWFLESVKGQLDII